MLLDCGSGVVANLAQVVDPTALDAVFITHNHPDHYADLYVLHAALRYAPDGPKPPLPLYLPAGLWERIPLLLSERGAADIAEAFIPITLVASESITIGGLTVTPHPVQHTDPTFALVAVADGATLTYTADTAPCGGVEQAAQGADLLLAEATLEEAYEGLAPHMTAKQAGALAREAGVRALALVHVWPTNDRERMARDATAEFGATVIVASEFDEFDIETDPTGRDD